MFLGYVQSFRALAILFIVAGHSIDAFVWTNNLDLERVLRILVSNGTVFFVFIAGYLFQHLLGKYRIKSYFFSKLTNVLLPYVIVSIPAIVIVTTLMKRDSVPSAVYEQPLIVQVIYFYLTGAHLAPLWFIPMISMMYLISPILRYMDKLNWPYFLIPVLLAISCFVPRGLPPQSFVHFLSIYMLGMVCSRYKVKVNQSLSSPPVFIALFLAALAFAAVEFMRDQGTMTYLNLLQKANLCLAILGVLVYVGERLDKKWIGTVADTSFGVFFLHSYLLSGSKMVWSRVFGVPPTGGGLWVILLTSLVMFSCVQIVLLVKSVLGSRSRYLVGS